MDLKPRSGQNLFDEKFYIDLNSEWYLLQLCIVNTAGRHIVYMYES